MLAIAMAEVLQNHKETSVPVKVSDAQVLVDESKIADLETKDKAKQKSLVKLGRAESVVQVEHTESDCHSGEFHD